MLAKLEQIWKLTERMQNNRRSAHSKFGAVQRCAGSCRSPKIVKNAYLLLKIGVDTAENEPAEILKFDLSSDNTAQFKTETSCERKERQEARVRQHARREGCQGKDRRVALNMKAEKTRKKSGKTSRTFKTAEISPMTCCMYKQNTKCGRHRTSEQSLQGKKNNSNI